jgi:nitroreductase
MPQNKIKIANTKYPVLEIIKNRFSPYSFADKEITDTEINTIIEAGSWSFSSSNLQPWRLIVAKKGSPNFTKIWECLSEGNKIWAINASVLMVGLAKRSMDIDPQSVNRWAEHDLGAFTAMMILQANSMGLIAHPMGGFSAKKMMETFELHNELNPTTIIAIGYLDELDSTPEPFKTRDLTPRKRKDITEIVIL